MALNRKMRYWFGDPTLAFTVLGLTVFGIAMIYSAGQLEVPRVGMASVENAWKAQVMWFALSIIGMFVVMRVNVRWLEWVAIPAYVASVAALLATLLIGTGQGTAEGTRSWLRIGPMMLQPAQFANLATVLMLGRLMGSWREP